MESGDRQIDETQDSLIGDSIHAPIISYDTQIRITRDAATPMDLNLIANTARNEQELSPLTQKLVKEASMNDNQIVINSPQTDGQPRESDTHAEDADHANERKSGGGEEKRGNQAAEGGLEESQRGQGRIGAKATPSKQAISPIEIDFSSLGNDLASEHFNNAAGNAESMTDNAAAQHKAYLSASRWKNNSSVGAKNAQHSAYQTVRPMQGMIHRINTAGIQQQGKSPRNGRALNSQMAPVRANTSLGNHQLDQAVLGRTHHQFATIGGPAIV